VRLAFSNYHDSETNKWKTQLDNIYCADSLLQTKSGIKLGDDKFDIIKKMERNRMTMVPEAELSPTFTDLILDDGYGKIMIFHFKDNKLFALEIEYSEFGC
jgi:hypothetical protein